MVLQISINISEGLLVFFLTFTLNMAPAGSSKNFAYLYTTPHTVAGILFLPYILSLKIDHLFKQKKKKNCVRNSCFKLRRINVVFRIRAKCSPKCDNPTICLTVPQIKRRKQYTDEQISVYVLCPVLCKHCECGAYLTFAFNRACNSICNLCFVSAGTIILGTVSQGKLMPKFRMIL
jgi:hypothetical protein